MLATTPLEAVKELDDALERGDLEAVLSFYEDDAVVVVEPGRLARGKKDLGEFFYLSIYAHSQRSSDKDSCNRGRRYRALYLEMGI
jgi:ketosteroid isomerase-like protein